MQFGLYTPTNLPRRRWNTGWVPNIEAQLRSAELTAMTFDTTADWLAKVDPEIAKQLHDDIRVRDNGFTLNETKVEAEPRK